MPKAFLFDADGVALKKQPYFSKKIAEEYNVPYELMEPFYLNELKPCQVGKADIKEELAKYLPKWNWTKSVDEFLQYWFTTDVHPDEQVLALVGDQRARGIKCYLSSDQEKYRGEYIRTVAGLGAHFDGTFFSFEVGFSKSSPEYFKTVAEKIGLKPEEIQFWDDDQGNVDVAKSVGIDAHFWTSIEDFKAVNP